MIMAFLGGKHTAQLEVLSELKAGLRGAYKIVHINNDPKEYSTERKCAHLAWLKTTTACDAVTVVSGVSTRAEYELLDAQRAIFCLLPGALPGVLLREGVPVTEEFQYVAGRFTRLNTDLKRRLYGTVLQAFSECYQRHIRARE